MVLVEATAQQFPIIRELAYKIWPHTYGATHSQESLDYMLGTFYALSALEQQKEQGHVFILAQKADTFIGFVSYELHAEGSLATKIHKLYVLPEVQGTGVGKALVAYVIHQAKVHHDTTLYLNVNKQNSAISFYKKNGFEIIKDIVIDIGAGFIMDDYVMELIL
ncbi:GNAT family N-acetyltransferase [Flavobacterium aciduliphilum]|uniref:Ribosomal protein S18 acetylase RimI-like enzyme n=1 Tax=Flavobacterium aciduliphilum TaxID=1101402 RepID=A0A328Z055_9FLAO|nr:GNAT family N-acetyltransferase [Flavobacterium aciduliphilum]RAR75666.1 ribosomal protein S18 acetylase RimI-like enzyme [Flavobacterium aciduliphilum]